MYNCDWWKLYKTEYIVKQPLSPSFHRKMRLNEDFWKISSVKFFLVLFNRILKSREAFAIFPTFIKNIYVGWDGIGLFMKEYAEKERLLTHPKRMLISSYFLKNGTIFTPLLLFCLDLGLVCKKITALCNALRWNALTTLFNLRWMLEEREKRIQILVLWPR